MFDVVLNIFNNYKYFTLFVYFCLKSVIFGGVLTFSCKVKANICLEDKIS